MRNRTKGLIVALIVVAILVIGSTASAMALTHNGWIGNPGYGSGMINGQQGYQEQQGMVNGQDNSRGGMMDGDQQNAGMQGTPITGVTHMTMQNFLYQHANVQVRVGTTLTWTNQDNVPHSVTFKNGMKDSGLLLQGQSFSYTFNTPGTYQYYSIHPYMVAMVTVVS